MEFKAPPRGDVGLAAGSSRPLLPDVGILALVPDAWRPYWMSRHQMLTRLAQYFSVVWVNPAPEWRNMLQERRERRAGRKYEPTIGGFRIYDPEVWLPLMYRPKWLARELARERLRRGREMLVKSGAERVMVSLWSSEWWEALDLVEHDTSSYHVVDENSYSAVEAPPSEAELRILKKVDQVIVRSVRLRERKRPFNPRIALIPNGVDYCAFAGPCAEPADLARIPHPRMGYTGFLKKTLDWQLLRDLVTRHTEWQFVFVGKEGTHAEIKPFVAEFRRRANVHFLGEKTAQELAEYPQHFDVCLMPYVINGYTNNMYPLKLHEFLASGRPVVGSQICTLERFSDVVRLPKTREEWPEALANALSTGENRAERAAERQELAKRYDWEILARKTAWTLVQTLGEEYAQRFKRALDEQNVEPESWLAPIREDEDVEARFSPVA